jgi:muramoyltetrapeptide carboxypeptidase
MYYVKPIIHMNLLFPSKLQSGDTVMVVAPSDSLSFMTSEQRGIALERFKDLRLNVIFADNVEEVDEFDSSSIQSRVSDLHQAFGNPEVKAVIAAYGGYNSNHLLRYLDWELIQNNPKIFIGFSDTTALQNAILAKTGLVTYSGPTYARFGQERGFDYIFDYVKKVFFEESSYEISPSTEWSDDWWKSDQSAQEFFSNEGWWSIQKGEASGTIVGGNICTLNLLQGTEYMPSLQDTILFIEDDDESKIGNFDRDLQSLIHLPDFSGVKGIVIGRFQKKSEVNVEQLTKQLLSKQELKDIPIIANVDFGHTDPIISFPIGGKISINVSENSETSNLTILQH